MSGDPKRTIAARAAQELRAGEVVNLGIGIPNMIPAFLDDDAGANWVCAFDIAASSAAICAVNCATVERCVSVCCRVANSPSLVKRCRSRLALARLASSWAFLALAWSSAAWNGRGSISTSVSPSLTNWPSLNAILLIWPSTRVRTSTVLNP